MSLRSEAGRAIYSLLVSALALDKEIEVVSAQDCADIATVERALGVSVTTDGASVKSDMYYPQLAPDLGFIANLSSDDSTNNKVLTNVSADEYSTILSLSGRRALSYLYIGGLDRGSFAIRLTVDDTLIWDSALSSTDGAVNLIGDNYRHQQFMFNESLILELKQSTDDSIHVHYRAAPIL